METILELAKGLGKLYNNEFDRYMIAKCTLKLNSTFITEDDMSDIIIKSQILENNSKFKICESKLLKNGLKVSSLKVFLLKSKNTFEYKKKVRSQNKCEDNYESFNKEKIENFCKMVGDLNSIHNEENAIVPGILILQSINEYLKIKSISFSELKIKFLESICKDEEFFIELEDNNIFLKGIKDNIFVKGEIIYD